MKFPETHTAEVKTLHIPALTGGLDFSNSIHSSDPTALKIAQNIWENYGILENRPALCTSNERLIGSSEFYGGMAYTRKTTDIEIQIEGDKKQMILEEIDYDSSVFILLTHFINSDGTVFCDASIIFQRVSDETFYIPQKVHFYKGKPKNGSGIFALVYTVNCENNTQNDGRIFELSEDLTRWQRLYSQYIPTALINGRGNMYETAKDTNQAFTGTPTRIEGLNALNGTFHAYYSTDGFSSSFRLPFSGISNDRVVCRLYYSVASFVEWIIPEGLDSASTTLYGVNVTIHINREKGIVYFTVPAGEYEMPLISDRNENNLRITATKDTGFSLTKITSANYCISSHNKTFLAFENKVLSCRYDNPLYFPVNSAVPLGSEDSPITAFGLLGSKLIAFKKAEAYSLTLKEGKTINTTSLLAENDSVFFGDDILTSNALSYTLGCDEPHSVISGKNLYWLGNDRRLYRLDASGKIICILNKDSTSLFTNTDGFSHIIAQNFHGYNAFFSDWRCMIMQFDPQGSDNIHWYYWEFPKNIRILGSFSVNGEPMLLCREINNDLCFTASLSGESDTYLTYINYELTAASVPIKALLRTNRLSLSCDNSFKKIDEIVMSLKGKAEITVNDRLQTFCKRNDELATVTLRTGLCDINTVDIAVSCNAPLRIGSIDIKYINLQL